MRTLENQIGRCRRAQRIMSALLALGFLIFFVLAYRPANKYLRGLQDKIQMRRDEVQANHLQARNMPQLAEEVRRLRALHEADGKLSKQADYAPFMKDITGISSEANVRRLAVQPGVVRTLELFREQPINMSFEGDFYSVFSFLRQLEDMPRLMRMKSLTITDKDTKSGRVEVKVTVNVYFAEQ